MKKVVGYAALASLIAGLVMIWLLLRKPPTPFVEPTEAAAQSFNQKILRLTAADELGVPAEVRFTAPEINSQIQAWLKARPPSAGDATIKSAIVRLDGEKLIAVLATTVKGQDVYVTIGGHLDFSNRAVRLVPTEVRIGSVPVPASWMQGKIDMHMELPEGITGVRIENSELVVQTD